MSYKWLIKITELLAETMEQILTYWCEKMLGLQNIMKLYMQDAIWMLKIQLPRETTLVDSACDVYSETRVRSDSFCFLLMYLEILSISQFNSSLIASLIKSV